MTSDRRHPGFLAPSIRRSTWTKLSPQQSTYLYYEVACRTPVQVKPIIKYCEGQPLLKKNYLPAGKTPRAKSTLVNNLTACIYEERCKTNELILTQVKYGRPLSQLKIQLVKLWHRGIHSNTGLFYRRPWDLFLPGGASRRNRPRRSTLCCSQNLRLNGKCPWASRSIPP